MKDAKIFLKVLHSIIKENPLESATAYSAGIDLRACFDEEYKDILAGDRLAIAAGIAIEIASPNIAAFIYSRSGLGTKQGLVVSQGVGVIDPDYRGEIIVSLLNSSKQTQRIEKGMRIAQLVFQTYAIPQFNIVEELKPSSRGEGGFGSTGNS